tara:strand:- start:4599 stop:4799 length:201 start_codon:yes stop_codon:yes gene_type:complete
MIDYAGRKVALVDANTGVEIKKGDAIVTFRGKSDEVRFIEPPHKPSASGRVNGFYASVYGLKFVVV